MVMALVGATIGKITIIPSWCKGFNVSRALAVIRFSSKCMPKFYMNFFRSRFIQQKILLMTSGSAQPVINLAEISKFKIPIPPLKEQNEIISILDNVDSKIVELESKKTSLGCLKKELMQKLLTGKIRVKI